MAIRDKKSGGGSGHELRNFTGRENELAIFKRMLNFDEPAHLPAVMFFGVSGTGKSWLLKRLRDLLRDGTTLLSSYVDFDRRSDGASYVTDFSALLRSVRRQIDVECPTFDIANAWMRFKQGAGDRPPIRHSGKASTAWEFVKEGVNAVFNWVPGLNLFVWVIDKLGKVFVKNLGKSPTGSNYWPCPAMKTIFA